MGGDKRQKVSQWVPILIWVSMLLGRGPIEKCASFQRKRGFCTPKRFTTSSGLTITKVRIWGTKTVENVEKTKIVSSFASQILDRFRVHLTATEQWPGWQRNEQKKKKSRPEHQQHEQRRQKQQQIHRKRGEERGERREDWGASAVSSRALIWRFWYEGRTWPTRRPPKTTLNLNITRMCTVPHGKVTTSQYKANKASSECALFPKESWSVATDFGHPRKEKRETTWKRKKHFLKENKRKIKE